MNCRKLPGLVGMLVLASSLALLGCSGGGDGVGGGSGGGEGGGVGGGEGGGVGGGSGGGSGGGVGGGSGGGVGGGSGGGVGGGSGGGSGGGTGGGSGGGTGGGVGGGTGGGAGGGTGGGTGGGVGGGTGGGVGGGAGGGTGGGTAGTAFVATLTGTREVPATTSTATGTLVLTLNAAETSITYAVTHNVMGIQAGHFHTGFAFETGPVAITLAAPLTSPITGTSSVTAQQVADLKAGKWYVNLHNTANSGGDIRGQVLRPSEQLYRAAMTGAAEVPAVTTNGSGGIQVVLSSDMTKINCNGSYSGITNATAAHLHTGAPNANGAVAVTLTLNATGNSGTLTCVDTAVTSTIASSLNAGAIYANVHSMAHSGGEIRGQLSQP